MNYLRSLFLNFLIVFFVDRILPGMEVGFFEGVPNIGADILFSLVLGLLNSLIFPLLFTLDVNVTLLKMILIGFVISFGGFLLVWLVNIGVQATSFGTVVLAGSIVWAMSIFTNYLEMKHVMGRKGP